jgi:hypothetical protein
MLFQLAVRYVDRARDGEIFSFLCLCSVILQSHGQKQGGNLITQGSHSEPKPKRVRLLLLY